MTPLPEDMNAASAAAATTTQAGWQGADGRPAGAGRWAPLGLGPLETAGHADPVERRPVADEPREPRPAGLQPARRLHHGGGHHRQPAHQRPGLRRLTDAPGLPSLSAWHYHAAPSQAEHIGALIATLLDQSPSPGEALAHALATTRTPIPLTPARRR